MRFSRAVIRITLLGESHATFVAWSPPWDCEGVTWAPWTGVRALPDIINTLPLPVSMALIAPSCDWTKNNKDNDARNNDERLEQRNWEPRGGAGAGPGCKARWFREFGANIWYSRDEVWVGLSRDRTYDWWESLALTHTNIRRAIKDKHHHHFSYFWPLVVGWKEFPTITTPKTINSR